MTRSRTRLLAGAALAGVLALTACSGSDEGADDAATDETTTAADTTDDAAEEPTQEEPTEEEPTEEEPTEEETTPEAAEYDFEPVDMGDAAASTPPGTQLGLGDVAWAEYIGSNDAGDPEPLGQIGLTVLDVTQGDSSFFERYSNAEEFEGTTPAFMVVQAKVTWDVPEGEEPELPDFFPVAGDGSDLEFLTAGFDPFNPGDECGYELPEFDPETGVAMWCLVGLGTADQGEATGALFSGEDAMAVFVTDGNPYALDPLVWQG